MIKFYKFAWKRFNRKAKLCFLLNFLTSFVNNCSMVLIPILQKKMIELMTNSQLEISYICIYFLCGLAGVLAVIAESVLLSHLERTLQRTLQEELIESALKNKKIKPLLRNFRQQGKRFMRQTRVGWSVLKTG